MEVVHSQTVFYHDLEMAGTHSKEAAQSQALKAIAKMRYDESNCFWINSMQSKMVMHPIKPALDGKDLSQHKDANGLLLFNEMVKEVNKAGSGFANYYWPKPGFDKPVEKLSFVKGFEPWGWVIGTGIYIDDVDQVFMQEAGSLGGVILIFIVAAGVISFTVIRQLSGQIGHLHNMMQTINDSGNLTLAASHGERSEGW